MNPPNLSKPKFSLLYTQLIISCPCSKINPVSTSTHPSYFIFKIRFNIRYSRASSSKRSIFFRISYRSHINLCVYLVPCVPCPEPILFLLIYSPQEYLTKSTIRAARHCTLTQLSVTSTNFGPNIFLSTVPCSETNWASFSVFFLYRPSRCVEVQW